MLDYTSAVIQLAFVVFLVNQVAVAQKDPNAQQHHSGPPSHIPEQCRNGEMNANSRDCDSYFECVNGRFQLKLCPYGQNFDPATGVCCPEYVCPHAQGQQQQVKDQQQHDQQQQHNQQQDNQQQVNNQQQHVYDSTGQQSIECNYGDKRPDQTDCSKYFSCAGEEKRYTRRFCPHGKHFSERLGRCITGGCQNGLIFGEMQADAPCEESSGHSGYRSDPENCRRFYQCAQGKWVHKDCPSNLIWNQNAVVCDWPKEGDRCL